MNKVKRMVENPLLLAVFALKLEVWRYVVARLNETYIGPYGVCLWVISCKLYGPYPCTGTYV